VIEHSQVALPSHPVIFTKRYTSIVGPYDEIYSHPEATQTLDYEGELGVIFGKAGSGVKKEEVGLDGKGGWVWGYTVVNVCAF
jgi:2-keto-4-pentenoate hydratase/2-oxohepta-3-ene-1,7-dioic acid hydratase in catechol pathway